MSHLRFVVLAAALLALTVVCASAQPIISAKSGVVAAVEGKVTLDNEAVEASVTHFPEMKENSILRTEEGRAEVLLPPGFVLRVGENAGLKMITNRLVDTRVELTAGSAVLQVDVSGKEADTNVTIVVKDASVFISKAGVYRFDSEPARLRVFSGNASVKFGEQTTPVSTGHAIGLTSATAAVEKFDVAVTDALDNWSRRRAEAMALANISGAKTVYDTYGNKTSKGGWSWNPYFGLYTYIPMYGRACNPYYDYCYYSPAAVYRTYYAPQAPPPNMGGYGSGLGTPSYSTMGGTSTGASSVASSAPSMSSSSPAASSSSTASSAAASSSAGHGSAAGGGRGK